ncbi:MAG TPA: hypothetical protein VI462_02295, partial [Acidimicrobiia bacterium]
GDTGEVRVEQRLVRCDQDAKVRYTGDGRQIHGSEFWLAHVRGEDPFTRITLDVDYVAGIKGEQNSEADVAVKNLLELAPSVPGAQGSICDTMLRGTHLDELQRYTDWIVMNPIAAESVDAKTGDRVEKSHHLRTVTFTYTNGAKETVDIWYVGGRLHRLAFTDDGVEVPIPLDRISNPVRRNGDGTFRHYVEYLVPNPRGGEPRTIREPTYNRPADTFNRAENIRQIPPGDPDYIRLMGRRSDAEAANRQVDDHLYLRRARSDRARRQLFDLLAHALVQNAIARHRHRLRAGPAHRAA